MLPLLPDARKPETEHEESSQESSLDLGPVYSSFQITRAQRGVGRRWPGSRLMGQPRVSTGAQKESTRSSQQPAQPWEGPAPAAPGILWPCWQRALETTRPSFRQVYLQPAAFPMTQDNSMHVTAQAQAGRPGTPQLGSCHQTNCGRPSSGPPCKPSCQTQVPTAGAGPQSLLLPKALPSSPAV